MKATEILMEEHRVIERVLTAIEQAVQVASQGGAIRPGFFEDAGEFIKGFADSCHHRKEEGVLFVAMTTSGMPARGGPIEVMLTEHEQGRVFTRAMRAAAQQWQAGDPTARQAVLENAQGYARLLRQHIYKEDNILFPMADRVVPMANHERVAEDFERVEHEETGEGVHEKYLALAESLEKEVL